MEVIYRGVRPGERALRARRATAALTAAIEASIDTIRIGEPATCHLIVYRGDSGRFRVTVTNADGTAADVSTGTWDADIREQAEAVQPMASLTMSPVENRPDQIDVILSATTSASLRPGGPWYWDLELTMGGEVQTLLAGNVTVRADVSRNL